MMNQSKDPFEAAFEEQNQSPPTSPMAEAPDDDYDAHTPAAPAAVGDQDDDGHNTPAPAVTNNNVDSVYHSNQPTSSMPTAAGVNVPRTTRTAKNKEEDDEEEEENMEAELAKLPSTGDPNKMAKMQAILSQFTEGQMSRYESFRRSGFQKTNMRRLLVSATGSQKISLPMTIVVCGIAKLFVGELVETARMVMKERKESGPIRPCHIREAYRRLKLEGKVPKRSIPRLFH